MASKTAHVPNVDDGARSGLGGGPLNPRGKRAKAAAQAPAQADSGTGRKLESSADGNGSDTASE